MLFGFFIYNMIWYYDYHKLQGGRDPHLIPSFTFMLCSFAVGFLVMISPRLFLESKVKQIRSEYCLGSKQMSELVAIVSGSVALALTIALLVGFKALYKGDTNFWFTLKSIYWWPSLVMSGSLVVYQYSQSLFLVLFLFPLIQYAKSLRDSTPLDAVLSVLYIITWVAATVVLLFGSYLAHPELAGLPKSASALDLALGLPKYLISEAIRDSLCVGSNLWTYICLHFIPSLLMMFKILLN